MLKEPAKRANTMPRSAIREIMALAADRKNVINLGIGDPDLPTPKHIIEGGLDAAKAGWTKYTPNSGIQSLRTLVAARVEERVGVSMTSKRIVITVGAIGALFTAVMAVADVGDEILIPDPGWPNYESIVHLASAKPVRFRLSPKNGFIPDMDELVAKITTRTKAIIINTPGNPTGAVFPRAIMEGIAQLAQDHGIYVISDEVYEDIIFEGKHVSIGGLGIDDRAFIVSGFSKTYAMTGWRLGYLVCPDHLVETATKLQEPLVSCAPSISQKAGEAALKGPQDCVEEFRSIYRRRRDIVVDIFSDTALLPVIPTGTFYAMVDISPKRKPSVLFAKEFLLSNNVVVVPGLTFGQSCENFVRIAFTTRDENLRMGLERLRNYILEG